MNVLPGLGKPRGPEFVPGKPPPAPPPGPPGQRDWTSPSPPDPANDRPPAVPNRGARVLITGLLIVATSAGVGGLAGRYAADSADDPAGLPRVASGPAPPGTASGDLVGVADRVRQGVVSVRASSGASGAGFVIDDRQHIITNDHIVAGGGSMSVTGQDGRRIGAEVIGRDPGTDIAVLRVSPSSALRSLDLGNSTDVRVGERVLAVGSPLGLSGTVTSGIVSAVERQVRLGGNPQTAVQTDASINPGNSGGPLVNARGAVIGVNTAIATFEGRGSIGIGFAIPVDRAADVAEQIIANG
ncbi:MAG: trypsin-like serine protease [Pseudonocardiaceae bacterium]|nr:trypsin-like serine protease [Pseudonocardiaceae bacterium]